MPPSQVPGACWLFTGVVQLRGPGSHIGRQEPWAPDPALPGIQADLGHSLCHTGLCLGLTMPPVLPCLPSSWAASLSFPLWCLCQALSASSFHSQHPQGYI